MPFVNIRYVKEVMKEDTEEKRSEIARRVTDAISQTAGIPTEAVWVTFEAIPSAEWYVGGDSVEKRWAEGR